MPSIEATLGFEGSSTPPPLTGPGTVVSFIMRSTSGAATVPKVNAPAILVNAPMGIVRYDWVTGDTDTPGSYRAEWEVVYPDGKTQTFPTLTYHTIDVVADLDEDD